jgi:hypothetical protein
MVGKTCEGPTNIFKMPFGKFEIFSFFKKNIIIKYIKLGSAQPFEPDLAGSGWADCGFALNPTRPCGLG